MGVTPERARLLAAYAQDRRGWDPAGSMAALKPCARLNEDDVAMAWVRFCADPKVRTPGAFPTTTGPHWKEKHVGEPMPPRPPRAGEHCRVCGKHVDDCLCPGGPTRTQGPTAYDGDRIAAVKAQIRRPEGNR